MHTLIAVIKVRGSRHGRQLRLFQIGDDGIGIGDRRAAFDPLLQGAPQPRQS